MARDRETVEAEFRHDGHHVVCHCSFCIWRMVRTGGRTIAPAISAKIGADHGEVLREQRRNVSPHQMRLRKSVQQENGRPRTGPTDEDPGLVRLNIGGVEILELHWPSPSERRQANKRAPDGPGVLVLTPGAILGSFPDGMLWADRAYAWQLHRRRRDALRHGTNEPKLSQAGHA